MMRLSIGGSEFDTEQWAYNQSPANDLLLTNFTALDDRDIRKVEQIRAIKKAANIENIKIFGSAWSPPSWMRTFTGGSLRLLQQRYYQTWANYQVKFLNLMCDQKLPLWAISTNSEGVEQFLNIHNVDVELLWTPYTFGQWITENLGPWAAAIRNSVDADVRAVNIVFNDVRLTSLMQLQYPQTIDYMDGITLTSIRTSNKGRTT